MCGPGRSVDALLWFLIARRAAAIPWDLRFGKRRFRGLGVGAGDFRSRIGSFDDHRFVGAGGWIGFRVCFLVFRIQFVQHIGVAEFICQFAIPVGFWQWRCFFPCALFFCQRRRCCRCRWLHRIRLAKGRKQRFEQRSRLARRSGG